MKIALTWDAALPDGVQPSLLERAAQAALQHGGQASRSLEVILVKDEVLAELHGRFLSDASPTDVMAFELGQEQPGPSAEIYVSVCCARRVAQERGVSLERELALYIVHGCLHLCGFDDHDAAERALMRAAERQLLHELGYADDDAPHEMTDAHELPGTESDVSG